MSALQTLLEENRAEFVDGALLYAKRLCEELGISFEPPRQLRRKHIFCDGSVDVGLSYEDELRRTMFTSMDRVTAEIRDRFQQLQNLAQKYSFLMPAVMLGSEEVNLDEAPRDIKTEEFQHERARLRAFVAATNPDCKKELIKSGSLGLLKYIIDSKVEDGLPNIVIMLRIFLTSAVSNASCEERFSKLKLIKNISDRLCPR